MPASRPLPDSPDLDQLRRQAKELLRAARTARFAGKRWASREMRLDGGRVAQHQ